MKLTTCEKVCKECPFKKTSAKGWLGHHTKEEIIFAMDRELFFSCHMTRGEEEPSNMFDIENGIQPICRGFLISSIISYKLFGRNPLTGHKLRMLQKTVTPSDIERESILNRNQFLDYHTLV